MTRLEGKKASCQHDVTDATTCEELMVLNPAWKNAVFASSVAEVQITEGYKLGMFPLPFH